MKCSIHNVYHKGKCPDVHTDENVGPLEITPPLDTKFGNPVKENEFLKDSNPEYFDKMKEIVQKDLNTVSKKPIKKDKVKPKKKSKLKK